MAKKKQPRTPRLDISAPSSVRYAGRLTSVLLAAFLLGMIYLTYVLVTQAPFYMSKAGRAGYGTVYDRKGDVLFDGTRPLRDYPAGHFTDVGTLIGDASGQITNTLVGQHLGELADYSFLYGANGKAALYTTLSHAVNRTVYDAFGKKDGTVIACNWKTGELLCCVSKPGFDIAKGYADLGNLPEGSLLCKAFSPTVPGSTQKVSTLIAAYECCGIERVNSLKFNCEGSWVNAKNQRINCHKSAGHGEQTLAEAFANSCNPFFAQLVQSPMLPLSQIITTYTHMGYAVNGAEAKSLSLDGIRIAAASTELTDQNDFDTQWGCLGQGKTLVSPYQLMLWQCAVAGGTGRAVQPYLLSARTTAEGKDIPLAETKQTQQMFSASAARAVQTVMTQNAKDHYSSSLGQFACGVKSGTAQIVRDGKETENSLLAGFCLDEKCPVAFCIVIENRRKNELTCAQLAKTLLTSISENLK